MKRPAALLLLLLLGPLDCATPYNKQKKAGAVTKRRESRDLIQEEGGTASLAEQWPQSHNPWQTQTWKSTTLENAKPPSLAKNTFTKRNNQIHSSA